MTFYPIDEQGVSRITDENFEPIPLDYKEGEYPLAGFRFTQSALEIDLSRQSAKNNIDEYISVSAKHFIALLILIYNRLQITKSLPYMPIEIWTLCIASFCYTQYLPKLVIETQTRGVDEIFHAYGGKSIYEKKFRQYCDDREKLFSLYCSDF